MRCQSKTSHHFYTKFHGKLLSLKSFYSFITCFKQGHPLNILFLSHWCLFYACNVGIFNFLKVLYLKRQYLTFCNGKQLKQPYFDLLYCLIFAPVWLNSTHAQEVFVHLIEQIGQKLRAIIPSWQHLFLGSHWFLIALPKYGIETLLRKLKKFISTLNSPIVQDLPWYVDKHRIRKPPSRLAFQLLEIEAFCRNQLGYIMGRIQERDKILVSYLTAEVDRMRLITRNTPCLYPFVPELADLITSSVNGNLSIVIVELTMEHIIHELVMFSFLK